VEIPKEIRLGGHAIAVKRKENLVEHAEAYGLFDPDELAIYLDKKLSGTLLWETFFHEVVEAINHFTEMELEHKNIQIMGVFLHQAFESGFSLSAGSARKSDSKKK
jgi:hypothetical protein